MAAPRSDLYRLVDALPEFELPTARRFLEFLQDEDDDEEELTPEQERGLVEALESLQRGEGRPADEVFAHLEKLIP